MDKVFSIKNSLNVPDGTKVYPFLNAKDGTSELPWDLLDGFSLAAGDIASHSSSKIHVMPYVTQVTFVLSGKLEIVMKDPLADEPYSLHLTIQQAVLTQPGTFFQLVNTSDALCRVLYIVSPAHVFDIDDEGSVRYDDAVVLQESWSELARLRWDSTIIRDPQNSLDARLEASDRIQIRSGGISST